MQEQARLPVAACLGLAALLAEKMYIRFLRKCFIFVGTFISTAMKKLLYTMCVLTLAWAAEAQELPQPPRTPVYTTDDLSVTPLEEGVWVIETDDRTTMYLVEGSQSAVLIDTGTHPKELDRVVRRFTNKPLQVVLTHAHYDHAGGIRFFGEICLHPADTVLLNLLPAYDGKVRFIREGDRFDLGGKELEVVEMPGHTPGSIVLIDRAAGVCYSGDAFGSGQVWLQVRPTGPLSLYLAAVRKMQLEAERGITKIYCGHYPYQRRPLGKEYLADMAALAESILDGRPMDNRPFDVEVPINCVDPQVAFCGSASIVYDPAQIR